MTVFIHLLILLIAIEHFLIAIVEMCAWESLGKKAFKTLPASLFPQTKAMAANQGLYNLFLVAGLVWSLWAYYFVDMEFGSQIGIFFLSCVAVAGIFGGISVGWKIFWVQAMPALITLILLFFLT